jgi:hypothetical protein
VKSTRKPQIKTASVPSPMKGLDSRDNLAAMPEDTAIIMDNIFPAPSNVQLRNGYLNWKTGFPGWVESIFSYRGPSGTNKLFGASVNAIYDATNTGAVGAAVVTGLTNTRFQYVEFTTAGGTYLICVNGADPLQLYNGSTWQAVTGVSAPIAITGVTTSTLIAVNSFKQRLYFIPVNSTSFWYLPAASVGGAATQFDLGSLMTLGGYLMGMMTWTVENAQGMQEYAVFVTSEGQVFVYQGYDPNTTATWALAAVFRMGHPIGRRFYAKIGSDVVFLTVDGAMPLSKSLLTDRSQTNIALTDIIRPSINSDTINYGANFGWQVIYYPSGTKMIINVPVIENSSQYQYVMNTFTGAWCTFGQLSSPWNAACFEMYFDNLYYGGNTVIAQCDTGTTDNNGFIQGICKQAFNYFGDKGDNKYFTLVRPTFNANGNLVASVDLNVDYEDVPPTSTPTYAASGSKWNVSPWNISPWSSGYNVIRNWETPNAVGFCAATYVKIKAANMSVQWQATDYAWQPGGVL